MLVLTRADVRALLDPDRLIEAVAQAFVELSAGRASVPPRGAASVPGAGVLLSMPGHAAGTLAAKLVSIFPAADPAHQALIVVFDASGGAPLAVMDGTEVTAARTAAASAVAARVLSREDAAVLTIVGTSVQGRAHAEYLPRVRDFRDVRLVGRVDDVEAAVRAADVVCLCTDAGAPVIAPGWLKPDAHVGSVGYAPPGGELPPELARDGRLVVESRTAFQPPPAGAGELQDLDPDAATELGEILPERRWQDELTVYKSMGHAVEDIAAARLVLAAAVAAGRGTEIDLTR